MASRISPINLAIGFGLLAFLVVLAVMIWALVSFRNTSDTNIALIASGGIQTGGPSFVAIVPTAYSIPNSAPTLVVFETGSSIPPPVNFTPIPFASNGKIVVPIDGTYQFYGTMNVVSSVANTKLQIYVATEIPNPGVIEYGLQTIILTSANVAQQVTWNVTVPNVKAGQGLYLIASAATNPCTINPVQAAPYVLATRLAQ